MPRRIRIIKPELDFFMKIITSLCQDIAPIARPYQRLKQRNPYKLWHGKCQCAGFYSSNKKYENTVEHIPQWTCPNEFETSYAPERQEIIYCEKCYNEGGVLTTLSFWRFS